MATDSITLISVAMFFDAFAVVSAVLANILSTTGELIGSDCYYYGANAIYGAIVGCFIAQMCIALIDPLPSEKQKQIVYWLTWSFFGLCELIFLNVLVTDCQSAHQKNCKRSGFQMLIAVASIVCLSLEWALHIALQFIPAEKTPEATTTTQLPQPQQPQPQANAVAAAR